MTFSVHTGLLQPVSMKTAPIERIAAVAIRRRLRDGRGRIYAHRHSRHPRYWPAGAFAGYSTLDMIELIRERRDSHADFRIIAEEFYQNNRRCRRRDLRPRRRSTKESYNIAPSHVPLATVKCMSE